MTDHAVSQRLNELPFAVIITDRASAIERLNRRAEDVLGIGSDEARGQLLCSLLAGRADQSAVDDLARELRKGELPCATIRLSGNGHASRRNSDCDWALVVITPNGEAPDTSRVIELDRMLTRGEMAGEIAHEMNNHLTVLFGNVEIIPLYCSRHDCETAQRKLSLMRSTLEKIATMSDNLADYGRPQSPRPTSEINETISRTIDFMIPQNRFDRIAVETDLTPKMLPVVVDLGRLQQAFSNVFHNAADELRLSKVDEPKIKVSTRVCEDDQSVEIDIEDNGRGIPNDILSRILKERVTGKNSGEGFGLLACEMIMREQGGAILIDSRPDGGTRITLTIPVVAIGASTTDIAKEDILSTHTAPVPR